VPGHGRRDLGVSHQQVVDELLVFRAKGRGQSRYSRIRDRLALYIGLRQAHVRRVLWLLGFVTVLMGLLLYPPGVGSRPWSVGPAPAGAALLWLKSLLTLGSACAVSAGKTCTGRRWGSLRDHPRPACSGVGSEGRDGAELAEPGHRRRAHAEPPQLLEVERHRALPPGGGRSFRSEPRRAFRPFPWGTHPLRGRGPPGPGAAAAD